MTTSRFIASGAEDSFDEEYSGALAFALHQSARAKSSRGGKRGDNNDGDDDNQKPQPDSSRFYRRREILSPTLLYYHSYNIVFYFLYLYLLSLLIAYAYIYYFYSESEILSVTKHARCSYELLAQKLLRYPARMLYILDNEYKFIFHSEYNVEIEIPTANFCPQYHIYVLFLRVKQSR